MKKIIVIILSIIIAITLSACDYFQVLYKETSEVILKIELINYENLLVIENPLGEYSYDSALITVHEEIENHLIEVFMEELLEIGDPTAPKYDTYVNSHNGLGIRIIYDDGGFTLLTLTEIDNSHFSKVIYIATYDFNYDVVESYNAFSTIIVDDFERLLDKYFTPIEG